MGLDDRDYMRERHRNTFDRTTAPDREPPFTPPEETSLVKIVVVVLVVGFVLYEGFDRWHGGKQSDDVQSHAEAAKTQLASPTSSLRAPGDLQREAPVPAPLLQQNIQSQIQRMTVVPAPPAPGQPEPIAEAPARVANRGTVYHCKSANGRTFWAQAHCSEHSAAVDRITSVPPDLSFDQQVEIAERRRQALMDGIPSPAPAVTQVSTSESIERSECKRLDARVEELDALARQPQSASMQDWIRDQRKSARDRQFALHC